MVRLFEKFLDWGLFKYFEWVWWIEFFGFELFEEIFIFGGFKLDWFLGFGFWFVWIWNLGCFFFVLLLFVLFLFLLLLLVEKKNFCFVFGVIIFLLWVFFRGGWRVLFFVVEVVMFFLLYGEWGSDVVLLFLNMLFDVVFGLGLIL